MPAFTLNNAVDSLLKKEFDTHRTNGTKHPLMKSYGVDAVPLSHRDLDAWRDSLRRGIEYVHPASNLSVRGGVDDVWVTPEKELIVVDYKATSKKKDIELYESYKRQVEVYQWLFRKNGFSVSDTAYFVYVNADADAKAFDGKLEFEVRLIPHHGDDSWIEGTLLDIRKTLESDAIPPVGACDYCPYREAAGKTLLKMLPPTRSTKRAMKEVVQSRSEKKTAPLF